MCISILMLVCILNRLYYFISGRYRMHVCIQHSAEKRIEDSISKRLSE